jgi:hypothetical protein
MATRVVAGVSTDDQLTSEDSISGEGVLNRSGLSNCEELPFFPSYLVQCGVGGATTPPSPRHA